jgi:hypothetical protein
VPPGIERILAKCLAKDAGKRYASGTELCIAFSSLEGGLTAQPANRRKVAIFAGAAAVLALLAAGVAIGYLAHEDSGTGAGGKKTTSAESPGSKAITVDAVGGAAEVFRDGRLVGTTPLLVETRRGETVNLVLKRKGYEDYPVQFDSATERSIYTFSLDLRKEP